MRLLPILLLASALATSAQTITRMLEWDYPVNELNASLVFRVHSTLDVMTPAAQWAVVATITNVTTGTTGAVVTIRLPQEFFAVSASNAIGGPVFSEVLVAKLPATGTTLRFR